MKVTVKKLKRIIKEELQVDRKRQHKEATQMKFAMRRIIEMITDAMRLANIHIKEMEDNKMGSKYSSKLIETADELSSRVKWITAKTADKASVSKLRAFSEKLLELVESSKFWNSPAVLRRGKHIERLTQLHKELRSTFSTIVGN